MSSPVNEKNAEKGQAGVQSAFANDKDNGVTQDVVAVEA